MRLDVNHVRNVGQVKNIVSAEVKMSDITFSAYCVVGSIVGSILIIILALIFQC